MCALCLIKTLKESKNGMVGTHSHCISGMDGDWTLMVIKLILQTFFLHRKHLIGKPNVSKYLCLCLDTRGWFDVVETCKS